jgi:hypothetical protein
MAKKPHRELVPLEVIESRIVVLRGHRVMRDRDLAELYGVKTRALNHAVKRNHDRFPKDLALIYLTHQVRDFCRERRQAL